MLPTTKRIKYELTNLEFVPEIKSMLSSNVMVLYMLMWRSIVAMVSQIS